MKRRSWVLDLRRPLSNRAGDGALKYLEPFCGVFGDPDAKHDAAECGGLNGR